MQDKNYKYLFYFFQTIQLIKGLTFQMDTSTWLLPCLPVTAVNMSFSFMALDLHWHLEPGWKK